MLITRSTPRITYRIGMRAWFEALEDKSLPSLKSTPDGEVAAAFKGILKILAGNEAGEQKRWGHWHYQSTCEKRLWARVWQWKAGVGRRASGGGPAGRQTSDFRFQISDFYL